MKIITLNATFNGSEVYILSVMLLRCVCVCKCMRTLYIWDWLFGGM